MKKSIILVALAAIVGLGAVSCKKSAPKDVETVNVVDPSAGALETSAMQQQQQQQEDSLIDSMEGLSDTLAR